MSGLGKWSLGVGAVLLAVAVACSVLDLIPAAVIIGVVALVALGMAGYDAINSWLERVEIRRGAAKAQREHEAERAARDAERAEWEAQRAKAAAERRAARKNR